MIMILQLWCTWVCVIIDVSKEVMFLKDMVVCLESSGQKQLAIEPCIYKLVEYTNSICRIDINCCINMEDLHFRSQLPPLGNTHQIDRSMKRTYGYPSFSFEDYWDILNVICHRCHRHLVNMNSFVIVSDCC